MSDLVHSLFEDFSLSRRKALLALATLSAGLIGAVRDQPTSLKLLEQFLPQCAASITACYHLMQGNNLFAVEKPLMQYLPVLEAVAKRPSLYQQAAARLAAQGQTFLAILAFHRLNIQAEVHHRNKAAEYSRLAQDPNLQAAMISVLGNTYATVLKQPEQAMQYYQEVLQYESALSPLLRSILSSRIAFTQAQLGQKREALISLDAAHSLLPDHPEDDPALPLVDSGGLTEMYAGWTYFELSQPDTADTLPDKTYLERAWSAYTNITENPQRSVSERVRIQIVNHQVKTALAQRDLEKFRHYFLQGVRGAQALNSQKRKQEAVENWKAAKKVWGSEPQILELAEALMDH